MISEKVARHGFPVTARVAGLRQTLVRLQVQYDLDSLSDEALNELVSNIIQQTQGDPDVDFLGLADEDYAGGEEGEGVGLGKEPDGKAGDHAGKAGVHAEL